MPLAFLNYRRSDSQQSAQALFVQLGARFGPTRLFLDVGAILPGAVWPERIRQSLEESNVVIAIIGPRWIVAANDYGERRLDDRSDWVRNELIYAIDNGKPIVPVLVAGAKTLPPHRALPAKIRPILDHQQIELRDEKWDHDLSELADLLESKYGFVDNQTSVALPTPLLKVPALSALEIEQALESLSGWLPVESVVPRDYPRPRQELRKVYRFRSFKQAIKFMSDAVDVIESMQHHPRWENQWTSVTVHLSTWDIGNRISTLDIRLALELDRIYATRDRSIK